MKRLIISILTTLSTLAVIWILWQLHSIILLFIFSLAVAAALHRPIRTMTQYRVPRAVAMTFVYGTTLLSLLGFVTLISAPITGEIEVLFETVVARYEALRTAVNDAVTSPAGGRAYGWRATFFDYLPPLTTIETLLTDQEPAALFWGVLGITQSITGIAAQVLLAVALSVYWTADQMHFERLWLSLLPPQRRTRIRHVWHTLEENIGAYIRSEVLQSVLAGGVFTLGFYLLGSSFPYLMALLAAISWFIPLVGGGIGLIIVVLLGALDSLWIAVVAGVYTVVVFGVLEFYLEPLLYPRKHYSAILVILTMLALLYTLGLLGLLVAPPLALVLQVLLDEFILPSTVTVKTGHTHEDWAALEGQMEKLRHNLRAEANISLRVQSLAKRLDELIAKANATSR